MSSTKRFFLVYVSLIAIANSVHAGAAAAGSGGAAGVIEALGGIIGKFAPNQDPNMMQGGDLMNLNGGFGQQGMVQGSVQPVNFQGIPGMNQGGMLPGQMGAGGAMAGMPGGMNQGIGSPLTTPNGQPIIDPTTGQQIIKTAEMAPGTPIIGAKGQQIMGANGQPVFVPQPGTPGMGGMLAGPIDESVLIDPRLNPPLYAKIMAEAQADPKLNQQLQIVSSELNTQNAKTVRAALLRPILMKMNLSQVQAAQSAQAQQMQQQQAMTQASAAARRAEEQRIRTIEVEISRLEQENNQIMADLKRQGVSQEEINSIVSRSRQDAVRVAGNAGPLDGRPQMSGAIGTPAFGGPQAGRPQQPAGGLPAFGAQAAAPQVGGFGARPQQVPGGLPSLPAFGGPQAGRPQQPAGGLPAFGAQAAAPQVGGFGARPQQVPGGLPSLPVFGGPQAGRPQQTAGGLPALDAQAGAQAGMPQMPKMAF